MQLSNSQQRILADMGIQLWALRRSEPENPQQGAAETPVETEQAAINVAAPVKLIVVTQAQAMSEAAQRLFNAMLKAASLTQDQVLSLTSREFEQINTASMANKSVLLLGSEITAELMPDLSPDNPETVSQYQAQFSACFSLEEMLQQPSLKAAAWQALKHLSPVF
jgi:DNA polymerase III psi subunit